MRLISFLILAYITVVLAACGSPEERAAAHLATAQELFDEGDYVNAKLEALNAAQIEPKDAAARYLLALIAGKDGDARGMLGHLQVAVEEDPDLVEARIKLGTLYVAGRAFELAIEQATAAMALAPDNPDAHILSARLFLYQEEAEQGMAEIDAALALDSDNVEAIGMKALIFQENEPDKALNLLDEAISRLADDESRSLRELKLVILSNHERTQDLEQALLAMIGDAADQDENAVYQASLARFYREQGQLDKAENMLRDLAAAASEDAGVDARLDVVQFLAEVETPETAADALQVFIDADPANQQLMLALGDLYLSNNQNDAAVSIYQEVAALDPASEAGLQARVKLVADRVQNDDMDAAEAMVASILTDSPAYPRALLIRAGLLFAAQRYDDAIADLRVLLRKEPDNQRALLLMARSDIAAGNDILGRDTYRRMLELNPDNGIATRELVALMLRSNELDEVETLLEKLTEKNPDNMIASDLLVDLRIQQEDWPSAEAQARRLAARADPNGAGASKLGHVLEGQQRYAEATEVFLQALEKNPDNISMLQGLARSLNAQGKEDETIAYLRRRASESPDQASIHLMLGGMLAEQGQTSAALEIYESVIASQPELSPTYIAVAALYPEDATKRVAAVRRGLAVLPANLPLGLSLAGEYQLLQRADDLIELYEELLAAHPESLIIANNLAALLADQRYQDPASLKRAVQLVDSTLADVDDPLVMDTVGWVYYRNGDHDRAVSYLEKAATAAIPAVHYHLGMAYLAAGNRVGAKQELEQATLSADASFDGIEEARETLATL